MPLPINPQGISPVTKLADDSSPNEPIEYWYHRTDRTTAEKLASGEPPKVGGDRCFWLSSSPDGAVHKRGSYVVRYRLGSTNAEQMSKDLVAKYDSNPPNTTSGFLMEGEHWLGVKQEGLCCLQVDIGWGTQLVTEESQK